MSSDEKLIEADLIIDCIYERTTGRGLGRDVLTKLLGVRNRGGFRRKVVNGVTGQNAFIALVLDPSIDKWPNEFDFQSGILKYYGDNDEPNISISKCTKEGIKVLKQVFSELHSKNSLENIPPFFVFQMTQTRSVRFLGLAAPGNPNTSPEEDLKIIWKTVNGERVVNYLSCFTILDTEDEPIKRQWLDDLVDVKKNNLEHAPEVWKNFVENGREGIKPLKAPTFCDYKHRNEGGVNKLYYGVPGSGKSFQISKKLENTNESQKERILFHPDYTYSDFVGQILPQIVNNQITYKFTPGPFTRILEKAFHNPRTDYYLIIDEINRGNAPAIFGDIFQLLDRYNGSRTADEDEVYAKGTSEFAITNFDIANYIYMENEHQVYGNKVRIPSNLYIIATMNTSDQNVFTLDTAFQRRWDMEMIKNNWDDEKVKFKIKGTDMDWSVFGKGMNELIIKENKHGLSSEDKRLGAYFIKKEDFDENMTDYDTKKLFAEKVLKYLWDDAFKFGRGHVFEEEDGQPFTLEFFIDKFTDDKNKDSFSIFTNEARLKIGLEEKSNKGKEDAE